MQFGGFSEESLLLYQSILQPYSESPYDEGVYDFTRCVRPDGSTYGTRGRCSPPNKPIVEQAPEKPQPSGQVAPLKSKRVGVSMGNYNVDVNVNLSRFRFPGNRVGAATR